MVRSPTKRSVASSESPETQGLRPFSAMLELRHESSHFPGPVLNDRKDVGHQAVDIRRRLRGLGSVCRARVLLSGDTRLCSLDPTVQVPHGVPVY